MFLTKLLPVFIYPLGMSLAVSVFALALLATRFRKLAGLFFAVAIGALWTCSTPIFANWLMGGVESKNLPVALDSLPVADAIVVLGGFMGQPNPPRRTPDFSEAVDRLLFAGDLYRAGKALVIVISGGNLPWLKAVAPEAELAAAFLIQSGIPASAIVIESASRNTHENAVNTAQIFKARSFQSGLLVTSAAHMDRSLATFRAAGLQVTPASTDVRVTYPYYQSPLDLLPDADALARTTSSIKEYIGLFAYRLKGWA